MCLNCDTTNPGYCSGNDCSCDEQYTHSGYYGCTPAAADECKFYTSASSSMTCGQICGNQGGRCLRSYNDGATACTEAGTDLGCSNTQYNTRICICTRGCNNGPRCPPGQRCYPGGCG